MADRRERRRKPGVPVGFIFYPVPKTVTAAIHDGELKPIDGLVLGMMLDERSDEIRTSVSAHRCTKKKIAAVLGKDWQVIFHSFRRLKKKAESINAKWIRHVRVASPDPDDPENSTGYRIVFDWIESADAYATAQQGASNSKRLGIRKRYPPKPAPIQGSRRGLRETDERSKSDDNGFANAPRDRHDRPSLSLLSSPLSSQEPERRKRPATELEIDQEHLDALATMVVGMFAWNREDAHDAILGEVRNGHSMAKIDRTLRYCIEMRARTWAYVHTTLRDSGRNGPPMPEKAKAPKKASTHHTAQPVHRPGPPEGFASWSAWHAAGRPEVDQAEDLDHEGK
jgi:hypothetical protein